MSSNKLLVLLLLGLAVTYTNACLGRNKNTGDGDDGGDGGDGGDGAKSGEGGDGGDGEPDPFGDKMGTDVTKTDTFAGDNSGTVTSGADLSCDFEGDCCWANEDESDEFEWRVSSETPDAEKFADNFNAAPPSADDGNYLITASADTSDDTANLVSCVIKCSKESILLTVDHWRTGAKTLQACTMAADGGELENCVEIDGAETPGPSLVELPGGKNLRLVLVAGGKSAEEGDIVIINNIEVDFEPCDDDDSSSGDAAALCSAVQCAFESDMCSYAVGEHPSSDGAVQAFEVVSKMGPQSTGSRRASEGEKFAAAGLHPSETAVAEVAIDTQDDYILTFDYWDVTDGMSATVCVDDVCTFESNLDVVPADRAWRQGYVDIPKGAQKLVLGAVNEGNNIGMVGFDNLVLKLADGGDPADAKNAC